MIKRNQCHKNVYNNTNTADIEIPENKLIKEHNFIWKHSLCLFIIILAVFKQLLVSNLAIFAISPGIQDDRLMVNMAYSLMNRQWLGSYSQYTLVKGITFPLFLAVSNFLGISYITASTLLYSLSCAIFVYAIRGVFHKKYYIYFIYAVLLFNPVSMSLSTLQRVYRNGITLSQVLIVFGCFFAIYLRRNQSPKKLILWSAGAGLGLASLWNTREDAIWVIPFVLVITIIIIMWNICFYKTIRNKICRKKIIITILPVVMLMCSIWTISYVNYARYGIFTTNELNGSNFTAAMKSIYAVVPDQTIKYVSVPREKVNRLYQISPTLAKIKPSLEAYLNFWTKFDRNPNDNEVEDGWFFWALRDAVSASGYSENAPEANVIYGEIHQEIEEALNSGKLQRQPTMPSPLMPPWRVGYAGQLVTTIGKAIPFISDYDTVGPEMYESVSDGADGIRLFEVVTGNHALSVPSDPFYLISQRSVHHVMLIVQIYQKTGMFTVISGLFCYALITILLFLRIKTKENPFLPVWIILTGFLFSFFILTTGVAYNEIASCPSINYMYLSGAYPIMIAFCSIGICSTIEIIIEKWKIKNKIKSHESRHNF